MTALIQSKLAPPPHTACCVERKALLEQLNRAHSKRLSVIAAPSGFGKSTLLSAWYARANQHARNAQTENAAARSNSSSAGKTRKRVAWLSLDPQDNEPERFFSYLSAAIRHAAPNFESPPICAAMNADKLALDAGTADLLDALNRLDYELTVVLDDFQCLRDARIAHAFGFMVWRSPPQIRWIVSGRCMPDLPLAQFNLQDQLHVIDQRSLSFDANAVMQLCHKLRGVTLSLAQAEELRARTEGWAAGLKLTLLADEMPASANDGASATRSPSAAVTRYIDSAVLDGLDANTREFLIVSSIADRFNADLCNALLGVVHSQSILDGLERAQLFIVPLDLERRWYRFHGLFGECLRACLLRDYAARVGTLHLRASRWYADRGMYSEALAHAFAGEDRAAALSLLAQCARALQKNGDIATILRWTAKLTREEILGAESVAIEYAVSLILCRRFGEAKALLAELEARSGACHKLATARLMLKVLSDTADAPDALDVLDSEPRDAYLTGTLMMLQSYRLVRRNRFEAARRRAARARELLLAQGSKHGAIFAQLVICMANRALGNLADVKQLTEQQFSDAQQHRHDSTWASTAVSMAILRYDQNRLAEAEALCESTLPLLSNASTLENLVTAYSALARIKAATERHTEAMELLDYLHGVLESARQPYFLAFVCFEKIRLALLAGKIDRVQTIAREFRLCELGAAGEWSAPREFDASWERLGCAYAALLHGENRTAECRHVLQTLLLSAQQVGYVYKASTLLAMLAACEWRAGARTAAFNALNEGLQCLAPFGFTRTAFDEAPHLREVLLAAIQSRQLTASVPAYFFERFKNFLPVSPPARVLAKRTLEIPPETLTERETDLLALLAQGLSNQEISERSQIAISTTKWHLKNVFAKLNVTTRTGALAKARELQLIR